jgi:hypothetical protein
VSVRPTSFALPDLSGLSVDLVASLLLSMTFRAAFPPGEAQHLLTAFVRSTESARRCYERARQQLEYSTDHGVASYIRGQADLELTFMALNRAMRLAEALKDSYETTVSNCQLPSKTHRDLLRAVRNAIDHNDEQIRKGKAGKGEALALDVQQATVAICDEKGPLSVDQADLGAWVRQLHELAVALTNDPARWVRS